MADTNSLSPSHSAEATGTRASPRHRAAASPASQLIADPHWYKDAVLYQLHVRAFYDSNGDGIGDFAGLTQKLDYLLELGATAIWLLPFYPSPLRDDGYDIADYRNINPAYGTMRDFTTFLREAHARGLRVITELVLNHTSDQHAWFQRARRAPPGSSKRDFYVWSDTPEKYREARIIFKDFEPSNWSWDPVAQAYYWHRFYAHQPDLNFDNPQVRAAAVAALDFWFKLGVDGLRLDAIPYLFEREGTSCDNLPETHAFLKQLRRHMDEHYPNCMLLAEANLWPEDAVSYFGQDDECHTAFHFPLMPRLFMATHMEDRFPIVDILQQTPAIPPGCQWMIFLRNHDELTLEMVTDEERDYMYRVYARDREARINVGIRRRLAPLLGNNRRKIELLNGLLFSLPGTPVIYYGDEIGMGDNIFLGDRNGVRTPMQWSSDRNAGFSRANPQKLYLPTVIDFEYHYETLNVENQRNNPHSLWWWMKRVIAIRQLHPAFGRGTLELLAPENPKVLAFLRAHENETILVVANLSRFSQYCELDLSRFNGLRPIELFGRTKFPPIGTLPYLLTLGPLSFHWFLLKGQPIEARAPGAVDRARQLHLNEDWREVLAGRAKNALQQLLPAFLQNQRWFGGKSREIQGVQILESLRLAADAENAGLLTVLKVDYFEGEPEQYVVPLAFATGDHAQRILQASPHRVIADLILRRSGEAGVFYDCAGDSEFAAELYDKIISKRKPRHDGTELVGSAAGPLSHARNGHPESPAASLAQQEQSNTSINFSDRYVMKLLRRVEPGVHPEWEIGRYLTEVAGFASSPAILGAIHLQGPGRDPTLIAVLHENVPNQGTAWQQARDALGRYFEQALADTEPDGAPPTPLPGAHLLEIAAAEPPPGVSESMGGYLASAGLLGTRTAEMHLALAANPTDPAFAPEPLTPSYRRSLYQSLRKLAATTLSLARRQTSGLPPSMQEQASAVTAREQQIHERFHSLVHVRLDAMRIRCHGDYHLGQVLFTGKDFMIIDFEGEPARSLGERRLKRSALIDVAGMIRSFHYAAQAAVFRYLGNQAASRIDEARLARAATAWHQWTAAAFLRSYLAAAGGASFLPQDPAQLRLLLDVLLLEKAIYELRHELIHRPDWVAVPLRGILEMLP